MIEALHNIIQNSFEALFFPALVGAAALLLCRRKEERWRFLLLFLSLMFFWRLGARIYSSRYATGMIALFAVFTVALWREMESFGRKTGGRAGALLRLLPAAGIVVLVLVCLAKDFRFDGKPERFFRLLETVRSARPGNAPVLVDGTASAPRFRYYLPDGAVFSLEPDLSNLKTVLADAILTGGADGFCAVVKPGNAGRFLEEAARAYPDLKVRELRRDKHELLFRMTGGSGMLGEEVGEIPATLEEKAGAFCEDFESVPEFEVSKKPEFLELRGRGMEYFAPEKVRFSSKLVFNPATGKRRTELRLTGKDEALAGERSLCLDSDGFAAIRAEKFFLSPRRNYRGEALYRGKKGSRFEIVLNFFGKSHYIGGRTVAVFGCPEDGMTRAAKWNITGKDFPEEADSALLAFTVDRRGIYLDNIKIEEIDPK